LEELALQSVAEHDGDSLREEESILDDFGSSFTVLLGVSSFDCCSFCFSWSSFFFGTTLHVAMSLEI